MGKKKQSKDLYGEYLDHSQGNMKEILKSKQAGCFFCRHVYDAKTIKDWDGNSAICPECGMDTVIGDSSGLDISKDTLKSVNLYFFDESYYKTHPDKAIKYCYRYEEGKITHNKKNETFYLKYLTGLAIAGDKGAAYALARFYEIGSDLSEPDLNKAAKWYGDKLFRDNGKALARLGYLYQRGYGLKGKENGTGKAYECYAKSAALDCDEGKYRLADLYHDGIFVKKDIALAQQIYLSTYRNVYCRFVFDDENGSSLLHDFCELSFRLGKYYLDVAHDEVKAIRFFLISKYAYGKLRNSWPISFYDYLKKLIGDIGKKYHLSAGSADYDQFTFQMSFDLRILSIYPLNNWVTDFEYNEETNTLYLSVNSDYHPLIVDVVHLNCRKTLLRKTNWTFINVASYETYKHLQRTEYSSRAYNEQDKVIVFNQVEIEGDIHKDGTMSLLSNDGTVVAKIFFKESKPTKKKPRSSSKKKGKKEGE